MASNIPGTSATLFFSGAPRGLLHPDLGKYFQRLCMLIIPTYIIAVLKNISFRKVRYQGQKCVKTTKMAQVNLKAHILYNCLGWLITLPYKCITYQDFFFCVVKKKFFFLCHSPRASKAEGDSCYQVARWCQQTNKMCCMTICTHSEM